MDEKLIAAVATPNAAGGISVIRMSGKGAIEKADEVFHPLSGVSLKNRRGYSAALGTVWDKSGPVDEAIATVFRAPKSYTGEDVVEFSCHGGILVTRKVLLALLEKGVAPAGPGEFTKRAFLNGKLSLTQAEAVADLIETQSESGLRAARGALDGALAKKIAALTETIRAVGGHISAYLDYPEEEMDPVESKEVEEKLLLAKDGLESLMRGFGQGKLMREGIRTVIAGRPNVGKSTLMNLLAGCRKSIVSSIPGTTRDVVEETIALGDLLLRVSDTAGIRQTQDEIEKIGVELAKEQLLQADLILAVFDSSQELTEEDRKFVESLYGLPCIGVCNKSDMPQRLDRSFIDKNFKYIIQMSAFDETALPRLQEQIQAVLSFDHSVYDGGTLMNLRQYGCAAEALERVHEALATLRAGYTIDAVDVSIESVLASLLELSGEKVTDAIVNEVFSHFCVGK